MIDITPMLSILIIGIKFVDVKYIYILINVDFLKKTYIEVLSMPVYVTK